MKMSIIFKNIQQNSQLNTKNQIMKIKHTPTFAQTKGIVAFHFIQILRTNF